MFSFLFPPDFPYTGQYLVGPSTEQCFCHYNCVQNGDVWKTKLDAINNQKFLANKADSSKSTHLIERRVFIKYNHTMAWDSFVFCCHFFNESTNQNQLHFIYISLTIVFADIQSVQQILKSSEEFWRVVLHWQNNHIFQWPRYHYKSCVADQLKQKSRLQSTNKNLAKPYAPTIFPWKPLK